MSEKSEISKVNGGARPGSGRKKHQPTDEQKQIVYDWAGRGVSHEDIAVKLNIDVDTLQKYYKRELNLGRVEANALIGGAVFRNAMNGNFGAQKWWTQVRMNWKEVQHIEVSSPDGSMSPGVTGDAVLDLLQRKYKS